MKYGKTIIEKMRNKILNDKILKIARKEPKNFTRKRKLTVQDLILYLLNKKGLTTKMELYQFSKLCKKEEVSSPALLKQREKMNPEVFKYLNQASMKDFYENHVKEVKTYKGYVIVGIDGSSWEVPNTKEAKEYSKSPINQCPRVKVSNCFDVLNCYIIDTQIEPDNYGEIALAKRHLIETKELVGDFPLIRVMDRGYNSLSDMYHSNKTNEKFIVRLNHRRLKKEYEAMKSDDEWVEIENLYSRIRYYKTNDNELYNYYQSGNKVKVRFVKLPLETGEIEILVTNLSDNEFSKEELAELYQLRWGIETNYHYLKETMKATNITSGKETLIKQEIYSQFLVFNWLQAIQSAVVDEIDQNQYKHKMKININMAAGFIKYFLIYIMLEDDLTLRGHLFDELNQSILNQIVPIRDNRKYERTGLIRNKHHINKRKAF